nr:MAG TPA: hypothetical protein [Caudoviricetes sp.]
MPGHRATSDRAAAGGAVCPIPLACPHRNCAGQKHKGSYG